MRVLNITPQPQRFELLLWCSVIKPELTLFQKQRERIRVNTIIYPEHSLSLIPKMLNTIDMILSPGKAY